jgi:hypothetical protein
MKTKKQKIAEMKMEKIIRRNGYEYHLIECIRNEYPAKAFGLEGFVLKSCNKIKS